MDMYIDWHMQRLTPPSPPSTARLRQFL
jgi:hypothetical protein